ncbi:protein inturned-like isoform X1 [Denticeps clupeoides]|uniref:protein inturned-like isoform X1 n=1 Tax=Denticeps clupeoides TaxID=299321 RepID=UPI0010A4B906|nr:protein inturned-like isoform X1 [Denticeps clupeoides]
MARKGPGAAELAELRRNSGEDEGLEEEEEEEGSESEPSACGYSSTSASSDDLEPEWLDEVQKNGELFYLELSDGEEEATLAQLSAVHASATNHVRFSDTEAEVIAEDGRRRGGPGPEPRLKRLARVLRRRKRPSRDRGQDQGKGILKNQPGQRAGLVVRLRRLKDVCVYLNPKRLGSGAGPQSESGGLLEALLGVVQRGGEERIGVRGLVPGSPASRSGQILVGDVLLAVDDVDVTTENIERVLSCISGPRQVRLTLETLEEPPADGGPDGHWAPAPVSQLVRLLWGEEMVELQMSIAHVPHAVLYLSLCVDSESVHDEQEVLYQYPLTEASAELKGVRGVFLTLCDMLESVTGGQILSSSLLIRKQLVHVGYWREGNNLLVIGLPAEKVPLLYLQTVVEGVVRTLRVMHGSLDRAFCAGENAARLDHFFCLLFQQLIQPSRLSHSTATASQEVSAALFLDGLPAVRWLTLPTDIKVEVDAVLSDFESSDFGDLTDDSCSRRRCYVTLGSCLFYKGYLIANHLPKEDLLDVCLYCQHYCLLPLGSEQRVGQLIIWREVFPHRCTQPGPAALDFAEPEGRHFLLVVGLKHFMQCVLLEAGGCAKAAVGVVGPDRVYVDQVRATLLQLEGLDTRIEERLATPPAPCLSCADWFLPSGARDRLASLAAGSPVLSRLANAIKPEAVGGDKSRGVYVEAGPTLRTRRPSPQRTLADSAAEGQEGLTPTPDSAQKPPPTPRRDSLGSGGSEGSGGSGGSQLFRIPRMKHPNPFYLGNLKKSLSERETEEMRDTLKLTSGAENTLFHYVLMESVQGVFIAPTHREVAQLSGAIHPQLIRNFHHCCLSIRAVFQQSLPIRERRGTGRPQGAHGLGPVKEHGVLFQCQPENWADQKRPAPTMTYWVIGRMLLEPVPQEFYVCFHDSVPEVPVEMAFRLSFGLAL